MLTSNRKLPGQIVGGIEGDSSAVDLMASEATDIAVSLGISRRPQLCCAFALAPVVPTINLVRKIEMSLRLSSVREHPASVIARNSLLPPFYR